MPQERIQKILSRTGISSRRKAEELIIEGVVTINGKTAKLGDKAELGKDAIKIRGKLLQGAARPPIYIAFNKPRNVISMFADPEGRPTLQDYFRRFGERLFPVGRLDFMSEGLLLVTNDGDFAEQVQKSSAIPRVYRVKVKGQPESGTLEKLRRPTRVDGKLVHPHSVRLVDHFSSKSLLEIVLIGAGAIDLKALFERNGILVDRITRTAIGQVTLRGMAPGGYRLLRKSQADAIFQQTELAVHTIEQEQEKAEKARAETGVIKRIAPLPVGAKRPVVPREASSHGQGHGRSERAPLRPAVRAGAIKPRGFSAGADRPTAKAKAKAMRSEHADQRGAPYVPKKNFGAAPRRDDRRPPAAADSRYGRFHDLSPAERGVRRGARSNFNAAGPARGAHPNAAGGRPSSGGARGRTAARPRRSGPRD